MCAWISLVNMSESCRYFFGVRAFDSGIWVGSDNEEVRDLLDRFVLPPMPRGDVSTASADIKIAVRKSAGGFDIIVDNQRPVEAATIAEAALAAVKALDDALVRKLRSLRAVHAGAVVLDGRALMIPGSSHAGKSSLVAELLQCGAAHLSDEYALVDGDGRIHAYPRPLLLRDGGPMQKMVLPEEMNASFAMEPAAVGWILAVDYGPEANWDIHPISQGEAVMLLLRNTPHEMGQSPELIDLFTRCAAGAKCFAGSRGDVVDAAQRVLELVSGN
jgi:hypothetical protein